MSGLPSSAHQADTSRSSNIAAPPLDPDIMPGGARNAVAAMRAIMSLQSTGAKLIEAAASRERVLHFMQGYAERLHIDLQALPPVIHIAGTKGKGSTASMVESILRARGLRTGLFTSPHLIDIRERFRLSGSPVSEEIYLRHFWSAWDTLQEAAVAHSPTHAAAHASGEDVEAAASLPAMPGFFHFLTLLAFSIFKDAKVDVAVLEVGMGGKLDATNVVPSSVVSVCGVSTLDFDHMDVLGHTLPEIAGEKAGIFKAGVPAISVLQRPDAMVRLWAVAGAVGAPLLVAEPSSLAPRTADGLYPALGLAGAFQRTNAALAVALAETFLARRAPAAAAEAARKTGEGCTSVPVGSEASDAEIATLRENQRLFDIAAAQPAVEFSEPYAPAAPLAPFVLDGLRAVRWSGRAQVVDLPAASHGDSSVSASSNSAPADSGSPVAARLYIDGAHTERSLRACCQWFRSQTGTEEELESGGSSPAGPEARSRPERVLLFYCGTEKDALQLLLPLSTLPFDRVILTAPDWVRPSRHAMPTTQQALASFLAKKQRMGDSQAIADVEAGADAAGIRREDLWAAGDDETPAAGAGAAAASASASGAATGAGKDARWLQTLSDLWTAVHTRPEFSVIRARLAQPLDDYPASSPTPASTAVAGAGAGPGTVSNASNAPRHLPSIAPPVTIAPSISAALEILRKQSPHTPTSATAALASGSGGDAVASKKRAQVLVTGSLYLVGGVLQAAGWTEAPA